MKRLSILIIAISFYVVKIQAQNRNLIYQYEQQIAAATDDKVKVDVLNKMVAEYNRLLETATKNMLNILPLPMRLKMLFGINR